MGGGGGISVVGVGRRCDTVRQGLDYCRACGRIGHGVCVGLGLERTVLGQ